MLRNRELARFAVLLAVLSAVSIASGFLLSPAAGVLALLSAVAYAFSFFLFTRMRYQRIALLSERIDQVLHDADLYFDTMEEGELAILQSEIGKLAALARRKGDVWYLTVLNGEEPKMLDIKLDFLPKGKYKMEMASDTPGNRKLIEVKDSKVRSGQRLKEELMSGGGFVARISRY